MTAVDFWKCWKQQYIQVNVLIEWTLYVLKIEREQQETVLLIDKEK